MNWVRNRSDEVAVDEGCTFDINRADRVRRFFTQFLRHSKGDFAGKPFELLDWQWENIIAPAFGWLRPDGTRRFRKVGCAVPKKNGKSTLLSGIGIYMLVGDGEAGSECYSAAADLDQARIIYTEAANMVEASPDLLRYLAVRRSRKIIEFPGTHSYYKALSAEAPTKEGLNIHCLLFDELHSQKTDELWNTLRYGGIARRQPLLFWITTAGKDRNTLCGRQWDYAKKVQESKIIDTEFLPYICETPEDADWTKEETWKAANPSYGITLSARDFASDCREAQESVAARNNFKRYRLNMWCSTETAWIPREKWDACAGIFDLGDCRPAKCYIGLDLASTTDICSAVVVWKDKQLKKTRIYSFFWIPEYMLKRRRERDTLTKLDHWEQEGLIKVTSGACADYDLIRRDINNIADAIDVRAVMIDPWNATQLATQLMSDNFNVQFVRQGFGTISAACKEFERLILSGELQHNNNPVLNWMAGNVAIEQDAHDNIKPSKKLSSEKIDGIVAAITGLAFMIKEDFKPSQYEDKGLTVFTTNNKGTK